jgi:hypothetical protein
MRIYIHRLDGLGQRTGCRHRRHCDAYATLVGCTIGAARAATGQSDSVYIQTSIDNVAFLGRVLFDLLVLFYLRRCLLLTQKSFLLRIVPL